MVLMVVLVIFIYIIRTCILTFWILDILNMPFMEKFDTTYPLNTLFWILIFVLVFPYDINIDGNKKG